MAIHPSPQPKLTTRAVVTFYAVMAVLSIALGWWLGERNILSRLPARDTALWVEVALGAGCGVAAVALSRMLERLFSWARRLSVAMRDLLGRMDSAAILWWAAGSAIGEELFFRALLQPWLGLTLTSVLFGVLHMGPDRRYWPWTVMAVGMGFGFGWMYDSTGSVLAPILTHFTINFFNLHALSSSDSPH